MALGRGSESRRGTPSVLLIVGLANPGAEYEGTRHNVGGDAVRLVCERRGATLSAERRQRSLTATVASAHGPVTLAVPLTFMNESGAALPPLLKRSGLSELTSLVIAHDELDLEPGRLQLKMGGGLAGHNGLRSISKVLGTNDFGRLRIGIGKPPSKEQGANWVLRRPTGARRTELAADVAEAADALELLIDHGFSEAQRRLHAS